jgi:SAM-dependent methyltransferase
MRRLRASGRYRANTAKRLLRWAGGYLDRRQGLDTAHPVGRDELGYDVPERDAYTASPWLALPIALPRREVTEEDVFVDLGSGKGRIVLQAARRYPFKRVIGVELSPELNEIASANLERVRPRLRCRQVELVTADALQWEIPEDLSVVYLYNPFKGKIFAGVLDRLSEAVARSGRPLRIVYVHPFEHARLAASDRVVEQPPPPRLWLMLAGLSRHGVRRYELHPASMSAIRERQLRCPGSRMGSRS